MSILLENINYKYKNQGRHNGYALENINFEIKEGEFLFIIGHTGSGKSTLLQLLNALEKPTGGRVLYDGEDIWGKTFSRRTLRFNVGVVFQYPEHQLFANTVLEDVMYGLKNQGKTDEVSTSEAILALEKCGVKENLWYKSPFELSGGQQRKVAIAGVLALNPHYLVLDEPTAGLDPVGRKELYSLLTSLNNEGRAIVVVSHSMDDVSAYAQRTIVLNEGKLVFDMKPAELFEHESELISIGLGVPQIVHILHRLEKCGLVIEDDYLNLEKTAKLIASWVNAKAA